MSLVRVYFQASLAANLNITNLGMCPHLEGFYNVFAMDETISWIVDYRYSTIVPSKQLYGTVLPDLSGLAKTIPLKKEALRTEVSGGTLDLEFKYDGK